VKNISTKYCFCETGVVDSFYARSKSELSSQTNKPCGLRGAFSFLAHDLSESVSHQKPDRQNPHLIRCGYGAMRFTKKKNPALWLGFVNERHELLAQLTPDLLMFPVTNKSKNYVLNVSRICSVDYLQHS